MLGALLLAAWTIGPALAGPAEDAGLEIATKAAEKWDGFRGETANMTMSLVDARGASTERQMLYKSKEVDGDGDRTLVEFVAPADVKGTRLLTWAHRSGFDDQWLFMPAVGSVKRISAGNVSSSFMGSEFALEDLASQELEKYTYRLLEETKVGERAASKVEFVPVNERSGYSRQVWWIDNEMLLPLAIEYFDRKGEKLKTAEYEGHTRVGQWWRYGSITMTNHQSKKTSRVVFANRVLEVDLPDTVFYSANLAD